LAFRPFFLAAMVFAVLLVAVWFGVYVAGIELAFAGLSATSWHAHEMIFGYTLAVIAGFLLTAIKNWTGVQTIRGPALALLSALWLLARLLLLCGPAEAIVLAAVFDMAFMLFFVVAVTIPVLKAKQTSQLGIISKLIILMLCNGMFYLGALDIVAQGERWGLYSAMYVIIGLIMVMARRVVPFFITKGVDEAVELKNWRWLDIASLVLLVALWISDVFTTYTTAVASIALLLFVLHSIRLFGWYTAGIWSKPLLWVLYLAYSFIVVGFGLKASAHWLATPPMLYVHAFTYGGIGVLTMGMMARVILGHTGRNVFAPPAMLSQCFMLLLAGAVVRVVLPLFSMQLYAVWIGVSQLLWIAAFSLLLVVYAPMLLRARVDGRDG
jgi:uncharacterized protein involved in response to NO